MRKFPSLKSLCGRRQPAANDRQHESGVVAKRPITILVSGSDTGVGKTHIVAVLASIAHSDTGDPVQVVKLVETGVEPGSVGDAKRALRRAGVPGEAFTLFSFRRPIAPLTAAAIDGAELNFELLLRALAGLPPAGVRIIEGAGGLAVPLDPSGKDWSDLAVAIQADATVLVVPDRLGAINQARLTASYAILRNLRYGIWLNETTPAPADVRESNYLAISSLLPLWGLENYSAEGADARSPQAAGS